MQKKQNKPKKKILTIQGKGNNRKDFVLEIQHSLFKLHQGGTDIWFCRVPSGEGEKDNKNTDKFS